MADIFKLKVKDSTGSLVDVPLSAEYDGEGNLITSTYATQSDLDTLKETVSGIARFSIAVVTSLPTTNISTTTIYLLTENTDETNNLYTEYIFVNNSWEKLGTQTLDLSDYATHDEVSEAIGELDSSKSASSGYYISSITQTDGLIKSIGTTALPVTSASNGLTLSGTSVVHSNSVTSGTAGTTSNATLTYGGTFTVPYVTYDSYGHITGAGNKTLTMPSSDDTNTYTTAMSWTNGTSAGPTATITLNSGSTISVSAIPSASSSTSGVITTEAQTIAGAKTFSSTITGNLSGTATTANQTTGTLTITDGVNTLATFNGSTATTLAIKNCIEVYESTSPDTSTLMTGGVAIVPIK